MYYLKCSNCGHLNDARSEYLIFCSNCDKKLQNNYSDWKRRNSEKSFDDFKKLICISDDDIQRTPVKKVHKIRGLKYWIGFILLFGIAYAVGELWGEAIVKFLRSEITSREVLHSKWIKESYGSYGLTVETPVKLTKGELAIPENVRQLIDQMDTYTYLSAKGFKVMINSVKYNPVIGSANLQAAANGAINEIRMLKGVTDVNFNEDYLYKKDIPGIVQEGSYKSDGTEIKFINLILSKELILWQVSVMYQSDDEVGHLAAKRVIESVDINEGESKL